MLRNYLRFYILIVQLFICIISYSQNFTNLKIEIDSILLKNISIDYNDGIELHILNDSLFNKSMVRLPLNGSYGVLSIQRPSGEHLTFLLNEKQSLLKLASENGNTLKVVKSRNLFEPFDIEKNKIYAEYMNNTQQDSKLLRELYSTYTYSDINNNDSLKSIQNHLIKLIDRGKMKVLKKYPTSYFSFLMTKNLIEGALNHNPDFYYLKELRSFLINTFTNRFINTPETEYLLKTLDYKLAALSNENNICDWLFIADNYHELKLKDIESEYILIDFWATWCPPCMQQLPDINELSENYKPSKVQVIGINVDREYSTFQKATLNLSKNWIHIFDEKSNIIRFLDIHTFPTTILLDKDRNVIKYFSGYADKSEIMKLIK